LVAEAMLQQTQVSRVVAYFERFLARFPTIQSLAAADEHDVLALWSGLGYYRRAKNLHAAAREIVTRFGGRIPADVESLMTLPGVGRYTAGAISSIVFDRPAPIVDGNVTRVLLRVEGRDDLPDPKDAARWAWTRAETLVASATKPSLFNEGLMELGATVCLPPPASPACDRCPLQRNCKAFKDRSFDRIPVPKAAKPTPTVHCAVLAITDARGRILLEQRPHTGLWAALWQCPTLESNRRIDAATVAEFAKVKNADPASLRKLGALTRGLTHRTVRLTVFAARPTPCIRKKGSARWAAAAELGTFGLSNAQRACLKMADFC
jgi:A/G-specific adenine glycosylase